MKLEKLQIKKGLTFFGKIGLTFQVIKTAVAASLAWAIAHHGLGSAYPVFAPLAAMLVIQVAIFDTIERAIYRVLGTIGGVIIGMLISLILKVNALSIAVVVLLSFALTRALRFPAYLILQIAISSLLVLFFSKNIGADYIWARTFETLIGAMVAVIVNIFVLPPNPVPKLEENIHRLTTDIGGIFDQISLDKKNNKHLYDALLKVRKLVPEVETLYVEIEQAERSLRYSPLQSKYRTATQGLYTRVQTLERIIVQTRGITRSMLDISIRTGKIYCFQPLMTELMKTVILFGSYAKEPTDESRYLLYEALKNARIVHKEHYSIKEASDDYTISLNVGSIYTDANRIFEEIDVFTREYEDHHQLENEK